MRRLSDAPRLLLLLALARAFHRPLRSRNWLRPGAQADSIDKKPRRNVAKAAQRAASTIRGGVGDVAKGVANRLPGRRKGPLRMSSWWNRRPSRTFLDMPTASRNNSST